MFLPTSSSAVGWLLSCPKIVGVMNAAKIREIIKRGCICRLRDKCQTAKRHGYSKEFAKQITTGDLRSSRRVNLGSLILFGAQRLNRIDVCSASRREQTRNQSDCREQKCRAGKQSRIVRRNVIKL